MTSHCPRESVDAAAPMVRRSTLKASAAFCLVLAMLHLVPGLLAAVSNAQAAPAAVTDAVNPEHYAMLRWRNLGPRIGGRSIAVAGSERPNEYYFGATGGGLWKTSDGGGEWQPVTDGQLSSASVGAIAIDPSNPDVIYIGMGEGQLRSNVRQGNGIYKSVDGGRSWRHLGLERSYTVSRIRIDPANPERIFAAVLGDPFSEHPERGLYRSNDGGESWEQVLFISNKTGIIDLSIDPKQPSILFATAWQVYRRPWQLWSGGPESGLYRSTDGGESWQNLSAAPGLPTTVLGKMTVAVSPADSQRVYANIEAEAGGLYRSDDGGERWRHVNGNRKLWQRSFYFLQVRPDPVDVDTVYVLSFALEKSTDGGESFSKVETRHADIHDLWIDPNNPARMIVGDDGGGSVSVNGGRSWTEQDYPTAQMYRVSLTNDFPYHVCGTQQDNRAVCVPSRNTTGLPGFDGPFAPHYHVSGSESGYVAQHPAKPELFFTGGTNQLLRFNRSSAALRDVSPYPYVVMGQTASSMRERWNWTYPITFDPKPPHALYVGSQHVWRSTDEGEKWKRISPDLSVADPETLGETGGPIRSDQDGPEVYATIYTLAVSPLQSRTLWVGTDDGKVQQTRNSGKRWTDVTPKALPARSKISFIDPSPHENGGAYVVAKRHELGDRAPYAFRTRDHGASWDRIDGDLPKGSFLHAIREDPVQPGLLYVATEHGVSLSFDDGERWHDLSLNLPDTPITGLIVAGDELVIATHGRSFYALEGLTTLRALKTAPASADAPTLYPVADAVRSLVPAQLGLYLSQPAQSVSVVIENAAGKVIRTLAQDRALPAGAHRLTWNLRHDGALAFDGMILESLDPRFGPLAVPGTYRVRLTADGAERTQPIALTADPRSPSSTRAMQAQLEFALELRDGITRAHETIIDIRERRAALDGASALLPVAVQRFLTESAAIEAQLYQVRNSSPKDKIAYPIALNDRLAGLAGYVAFGANAPTAAQRAVATELLRELDALLEQYDNLKETYSAAIQ